jgi:hypothetical protein
MALNLKKYDPGIHCTLAYWMAKCGQREEEIAAAFGIPLGTLHSWRNRRAELREAMKPGRELFKNLVAGSLAKRALGYDFEEVTRERVAVEFRAEGSAAIPTKWKMKVTKRVKKNLPPDVGACVFYLVNRDSENWRDVKKVEVSGNVTQHADLSALSDEELKTYRAIAAKVEASVAGRN